MAYGRLSTPAPTIKVTLWNVTYHHLARRGVASPVASSTTWSTRKQHLLVNGRRLNQAHAWKLEWKSAVSKNLGES
jgi:hypothetical protein